jgi:hypothetical protein
MRHAPLSTFAIGCVLAVPAAAVEFVPGWETGGAWESNAGRVEGEEESGFSLRGGPELRLRRPRGDVTFDVRYAPRYDYEFALQEAGGFDHFVSGDLDWVVTPVTTLSLGQDLSYTTSLLFLPPDAGVTEGGVETSREHVLRSITTLRATRSLSPVSRIEAIGTGQLFEYEEEGQADGRSFSGALQWLRTLSPRTSVGFGSSVTRQDFDKTQLTDEGRGTTFYQGYGILSYSIDDKTSLNLQGGPAWTSPDEIGASTVPARDLGVIGSFVQRPDGGVVFAPVLVRASSCPPAGDNRFILFPQSPSPCAPLTVGGQAILPFTVVGGNPQVQVPFVRTEEVEGSLTAFGRVALSRRWRLVTGTLSYQRTASAAGGFGTSTNLDTLSAALAWRPNEDWTVSTTSSWNRQLSSSEVPVLELLVEPAPVAVRGLGIVQDAARVVEARTRDTSDSAIETQSYRLDLRVNRRIDEHLSIVGGATYWWQKDAGDLQIEETRSDLRFELGLSWVWDPVRVF